MLIVEDEHDIRCLYKAEMEDSFDLFFSENLRQGFEFFSKHWKELDAIVLDGLLDGLTSLELAKFMSRRYEGPMVATSNHKSYIKRLQTEGGCQYAVEDKTKLAAFLRKLLKVD